MWTFQFDLSGVMDGMERRQNLLRSVHSVQVEWNARKATETEFSSEMFLAQSPLSLNSSIFRDIVTNNTNKIVSTSLRDRSREFFAAFRLHSAAFVVHVPIQALQLTPIKAESWFSSTVSWYCFSVSLFCVAVNLFCSYSRWFVAPWVDFVVS